MLNCRCPHITVFCFVLLLIIYILFQEKKEIMDAFENYKEEMSDVSEMIEIATLDKEMAEEKVGV